MAGTQFGSQTRVPPAPGQEVAIRTMSSDIRSIAQGEVTPIAEVMSPSTVIRDSVILPAQQGDSETTPKKHKGKMILIIALSLLLLGLIAYFVIYPIFMAGDSTVTAL